MPGQAALLSGEGAESLQGPGCSKAQVRWGRGTFIKSFSPGEGQAGAGIPLGPPQCQSPELCPCCWPRRGTGDTGRTDPELGEGLLSHPPRTPQRHPPRTTAKHGWMFKHGRCSQPRGVTWSGRIMGRGSLGPGSATARCDKKPPPPCAGPRELHRRGRDFTGIPGTSGSALNPHLEMGTMTVFCPYGAGQRGRCQVG